MGRVHDTPSDTLAHTMINTPKRYVAYGQRRRRAIGYPCVVPLRRKSVELATKHLDKSEQPAEGGDEPADEEAVAEPLPASGGLPKGYTPSKRERGESTPKRPTPHVRRPAGATPTRSRKDLTKEQKQELREVRRTRRREVSEGMRRGDPEYLPARDQGPERAIARDVVDSRRTVGTWFFAGALLVLLGSSSAMPAQVQVISTMAWTVLALAVIIDGVLLCRRVKKLVRARHPDSTPRMASLYLYTVMRSLTFRRMRVPLPRLKFGDAV